MAEYHNDDLGVSFSLPDAVPVRQQLAFRSRIASAADEDTFMRFWQGALGLLGDWQCEAIPDPAALDLDAETDIRVTDIVQYVANATAAHMYALRTQAIPKNS